jgi:dTDP-4-dehydrorhamnose 3,5-epimerase
MSWAEVAREVFRLRGRNPDDVTPITSVEYAVGRDVAPRPANSVLSLRKLAGAGFRPADATEALRAYVAALPASRP